MSRVCLYRLFWAVLYSAMLSDQMIYNFAKETVEGCILLCGDQAAVITEASSSLLLLCLCFSLHVLGNGLRGLNHQVAVSALAELLPARGVHHVSEVGGHKLQAALLEVGGAVQVGNSKVGHHSGHGEARRQVLLAVLLQLLYLVLFWIVKRAKTFCQQGKQQQQQHASLPCQRVSAARWSGGRTWAWRRCTGTAAGPWRPQREHRWSPPASPEPPWCPHGGTWPQRRANGRRGALCEREFAAEVLFCCPCRLPR